MNAPTTDTTGATTGLPHAAALSRRHRALLSYTRRELPGWGRLYQAMGGNAAHHWVTAGCQTVRGKLHGYQMQLDLSNWSERLTWFLARYHDLPVQRTMLDLLRPGDCFVDIGANLGMLSLVAAARVGPAGRVLAIEPNPSMIDRLAGTVAQNDIANIDVVHSAVSDAEGTAELHEFGGHAGWGSLCKHGPEGAKVTRSFRVPMRCGDDLLQDLATDQPLAIKIDVEGHEVPVLRSLRQTLRSRQPLVFLEVVDEHQLRAGFSAREMCEQLEALGYRGFVLEAVRERVLGRGVRRSPFAHKQQAEADVVFVPASGVFAERFAAL